MVAEAVSGATLAPVVTSALLGDVGFTAPGIKAGSVAASLMSAAANGNVD